MFQYGVQRRRYSSLGAGPPGARGSGPLCGGTAVLKKMMAELGWYMPGAGGYDDQYDLSLQDALRRFARAKGLAGDHVFGYGVSDELCAAVVGAWDAKFSAEAAAARMRAGMMAAGRRMVAAQAPQFEEEGTDPIAACTAAGGEWDYLQNACLMETPGEGLPPALKYAIIGGVVIVVAGVGYGIYRATR